MSAATAAAAPKLTLPAPAKVNYFLHITGQRDDGYHTLETLFVLIDLADSVTLALRDDGVIARDHDVEGIAAEDDLCLRAARALKDAAPRRASSSASPGAGTPTAAGSEPPGCADCATRRRAVSRSRRSG